jgi:hypothetical protein
MKYLIIILLTFSPIVIAQNKVNSNKIKFKKMDTNIPTISDFPTGEENTAFAQYFIGKSYLAPLTSNKDLNVPPFQCYV